MDSWQYKTVTIKPPGDEDIDVLVQYRFDQFQDAGWEYVSGPAIERRKGTRQYTFMLRRPRPQLTLD